MSSLTVLLFLRFAKSCPWDISPSDLFIKVYGVDGLWNPGLLREDQIDAITKPQTLDYDNKLSGSLSLWSLFAFLGLPLPQVNVFILEGTI